MAEPDYQAWAAAGFGALHKWYETSTGLWQSTGWWNAANALTAVARYTRCTGDRTYEGIIQTTFTAAQRQHANFINNYYDDNGWWALAWIEAYDLTQESRYLQAAQTIFTANTAAWDPVCGGGLWWNTAKNYKNAIVNELFLTLAARLHQRTPNDQTYLNWALKEWEWFSSSGLIGPHGMVNDGLTAACANNGGTTWTYNQGVILGGLAALYQITGDNAYLQQGESIAAATLSNLTTPKTAKVSGILTEPCETAQGGCNGDQVQFKGIFARNLYDFYLQNRELAYGTFILANATSVWNNSKNAARQFGMRWTGPFDRADAGRQGSALDVLNAAVALTASPAQP
jgi:predicted alpha-1,6-mannanase (GH76 family)